MFYTSLFRYIHNVFLYFGIRKSELKGLKAALYDVYSFILKAIVILASISFIFNVSNMNKLPIGVFSNFIGAACTCTVTAIKILLCDFHQIPQHFEEIFRKEEEMNKVEDKYLKKMLRSTTEPIFRAFFIYMLAVILTNVSFMGLCGYLRFTHTNNKNAIHPFEMLLPFDRDQYYTFALIIYMLTESVTAFMAYTMDMALLVFIIFHILRLKILQQVLKHFKHYMGFQTFLNDMGGNIKFQETAHFWQKCIYEHQAIISDVELLNKQISNLFLVDFFLRTIQMAGFCLGGILTDQFLNKFFGFGCLLCTFSQLTILYWYGQVLTSESVAISDAVYESDWYDTDVETQKTLLIIMMRSQRSLNLTVGKFEKVALRTVLKILKSIYSCMSIIIQRK